jgi:hypothetical protein
MEIEFIFLKMQGDCCHFRLPTKINNMMRQLQQISFSLKENLRNSFLARYPYSYSENDHP